MSILRMLSWHITLGTPQHPSIHPQLITAAFYDAGTSTEAVLRVSYQPLAVFRVRPVTRCTSTMPGHTEAVLQVSYSPDGSMLASGGGDMTVR